VKWDSEADEQAAEVLSGYAAQLYAEAERVAQRARAGSVSGAYVDDAAFTIGIRQPSSAWPDLLLAIGIGLVGIAAGVLAVMLTTPQDIHLKLDWVGPAAVGLACIGFLLSGVGGALKLRAG
jgi:hypothetical protein